MITSMVDRTWTEDASGGYLETHIGDFAVGVIRGDDSERVVVRGELNGATAPLLLGVLDSVYARPPRRVEVDLSGVRFLSGSGVTLLLATRRRLAARGATLAFLGPVAPIVWRLLTLTDTDHLIESPRFLQGPPRELTGVHPQWT